jgi:SAM-dependent methyltransferase
MKSTEQIVAKFEQAAAGYAERVYTNLDYYIHRRFVISTTWGTPLRPGDSVLELGCGDGYLAQLFVEYGLKYQGMDISPKMVAAAERRLQKAGLKAALVVADFVRTPLVDDFDALVSFQTYDYVADPLSVLKSLRPHVRKKLIIDLNPRGRISLEQGVELLKNAGYRNVTWRPFLVPQRKKVPAGLLKTLMLCENVPMLPRIILRWKFLCLLKGETN